MKTVLFCARRARWALLCVVFFLFVISGGIIPAAVDPITGAEPAEGFGAAATGGYGKEEVIVTTLSQFRALRTRSNVYIRVRGDIFVPDRTTSIFTGSNVTIDGEGVSTIWGSDSPAYRTQRLVEMTGTNLVVKDIRLRNAGDNLSIKSPGGDVLISHVSSTGAYDDGISLAYGTKNATLQYSIVFGCTRSCYIDVTAAGVPENITLHHNWFKGQYMRGPKIDGALKVDVRNHIQEDWWEWGGPRFEAGGTGNSINNIFVLTGATPGKTDAADYTYDNGGPAYFSGSIYRGCSGRPGNSATEIPCAPVTTQSAAAAEVNIRANAGCLPRDAVDQLYMDTTSGWGRSPFSAMGEEHPWVIVGTKVTGPASPTTTSPIVFTINFNREVTNFTAAGITVTNGTKGALSGSGAGPYTLPVTPTAPGPVTCKVESGAARVATAVTRAGTVNAESNTLSIIYGSGAEAPTVTVTGPASPTSTSPIPFTITFDKSVTGFTADGIAVTNGIKGTLTGSGANYSIPVTPTASGAVTCKVNAGAAQDGYGTGNVESNTLSIVYQAPDVPDDLSTWAHRMRLRFAGYTGSETLTSFPLLVRLDSAQFSTEDFEPGGADLRFTDAADNPLPYEIEAWDRDGESSIWVVVPQIVSNTDYIQMLWGKPGAVSRALPDRVWTNGFHGVWHLGSNFEDSTAASRHATNNGSAPEDALIAAGADFDGAAYVALPATAGNSGSGSLSVWVKTSAVFSDLAHVFYLRAPGGTSGTGLGDGLGGHNELHVNFQPEGTLRFFIEGEIGTSAELDVYITTSLAYNDGQWHHVAATWEKPGSCHLYVNGELAGTTSHIGRVFDFSQFAALGKPEANLRYYTGLMDEARLESTVRSADWVRASYLNQRRDSTFIEYDTGAPIATVTGPASPTSTSPIVFTITFDKPVTGFTVAGIAVTNGTKGALTGSGAGPYTLSVTPSAPGAVTCQVEAGAAQDGDSNPNPASNVASVIYTPEVEGAGAQEWHAY